MEYRGRDRRGRRIRIIVEDESRREISCGSLFLAALLLLGALIFIRPGGVGAFLRTVNPGYLVAFGVLMGALVLVLILLLVRRISRKRVRRRQMQAGHGFPNEMPPKIPVSRLDPIDEQLAARKKRLDSSRK